MADNRIRTGLPFHILPLLDDPPENEEWKPLPTHHWLAPFADFADYYNQRFPEKESNQLTDDGLVSEKPSFWDNASGVTG